MKKLLLLLLLSLPCWAQNMRFDAVAWGPKGAVPNATVAVCTQPATTTTTPCSPLASLCSSLSDNVCSQPNPITADNLGNYHFYAKTTSGPYTVQIYGPQVAVPYVLTDQYLNGTITSPTLVNPIITAGGGVQMGITFKKGTGAGNYATTSTTFVDVDAANLSYTGTIPVGWKLYANATGVMFATGGTNVGEVGLFDSVAATQVLVQVVTETATSANTPFGMQWVFNGDGNSHTIKLQLQTTANQINIRNAAANDVPQMVFVLMPSN